MPRLMSVALTEAAVLNRTKTVTRRKGWTMLHPGDTVTLCRKVMGRRRGEPIVKLCDVRIVSVRREALDSISDEDVTLEGFTRSDLMQYGDADLSLAALFVAFFCEHMGGAPDQPVTRIQWAYEGAS